MFRNVNFIFVGHSVSFKSFNSTYIRGIVSVIKPKYTGKGEFPSHLCFKEPKQPAVELSKETKELFLYAEMDYIFVKDELKVFNREPVQSICKQQFQLQFNITALLEITGA